MIDPSASMSSFKSSSRISYLLSHEWSSRISSIWLNHSIISPLVFPSLCFSVRISAPDSNRRLTCHRSLSPPSFATLFGALKLAAGGRMQQLPRCVCWRKQRRARPLCSSADSCEALCWRAGPRFFRWLPSRRLQPPFCAKVHGGPGLPQ